MQVQEKNTEAGDVITEGDFTGYHGGLCETAVINILI